MQEEQTELQEDSVEVELEGPGKECPTGQHYDTYLKRCVDDPIK